MKKLQELVSKANEGYDAYLDIRAYHADEVVFIDNTTLWEGRFNSKIKVKPKPPFIPFHVGEKTCCWYDPKTGQGATHSGPCTTGQYYVSLNGEKLFIGNFCFDASQFLRALKAISSDSFNQFCFHDTTSVKEAPNLKVYRNGVGCADMYFSWQDCDRIMAELEKVVDYLPQIK